MTRIFIFLLAFALVCFFKTSFSIIRFCYKGPHKVSLNECPYGLIFNKPINTKCLFYSTTDVAAITSAPKYMEEGCKEELPLEESKAYENQTFQKLLYSTLVPIPGAGEDKNLTNPKGPDSQHIPADTNIHENGHSCSAECLSEYEGNFIPPDAEVPEYKFQYDPCSSTNLTVEQNDISNQLFTYLLIEQDTNGANWGANRIHELFDTAIRILARHCGENLYVQEFFLQQMSQAMKYLHFRTNKLKITDMGIYEFKIIETVLDKCLRGERKFSVDGASCATRAKINRISFTNPKAKKGNKKEDEIIRMSYRMEAKSFRMGKFDVFIEAAWAVVDFVQNYCYEDFKEKTIFHQILVDHFISIFKIREIQERWTCPTELKNQLFWNNVAGVRDVKMTMRNLDFCAQAAAKSSIFKYRLDRPFETEQDRTDFELLEKVEEGWSGTEESYWASYDSAGGIRNILLSSGIGSCATTLEEMNNYKKHLGLNCAT